MKEKETNASLSRRDFLKGAGCLTIAFPLFGTCWLPETDKSLDDTLPGSLKGQPQINAWLEILPEGKIRVLTGKMELGQGIRTAIAQVAAEELDMDIENVEVHLAETGRTPHEGYTAGSGSIENSAMSVRYAAAAARMKLMELAAKKLQAKTEQLELANGSVFVKGGKQKLTFSQILDGAQLKDEVRLPVQLKEKSAYKLVGKAIPRKDIERMVRGQQYYIQDLRFPGMVHGRIIRPSAYEAKLSSFDEKALKQKFPGIIKTVVNGNFLGLIATDEFEAMQAQAFVKEHATWTPGKALPEGDLQTYIKKLPGKTEQVKVKGNINGASGGNALSIQASYFKPYIMHGSIGPSCGIALFENSILHIWSHSQGIYPMREALTKMLGIPSDQIHIVGVPGSGCYGHNGADDAATDAALLAMAYPGKHVRVQWSRAEEHGWEPYGSAIAVDLKASLDSSGKINYWDSEVWTDSHSTRPGGDPATLLTARHIDKAFKMQSAGYTGGGHRNAEPYYAIPNLQIVAHFFEGPLRVSSLRGLGAYANIFALESFMDELAEKAGKDPLTFRLMHLEDERAIAVVKKIQEMTKNEKTNKKEGMGYAFSRYKNTATYCAVAAKVSVETGSGEVKVHKMWASIDAGEVINLDGIINQTEGGMIQSASWTLKEQVQFDSRHVNSLDWASYPIFRFSDVPQVEVAVINRPQEKPLGAGEAAQGPTSAAIANAVYRACGKRIRHLPIEQAMKQK
ncbi:xanthine dehydrogenase family protein molybdopterin-binding subunit [Rhodocytophaga rosea]|uniref:Xanthine dehydrogenase family protein molybdopterin-binding subunit n=1 Tax=Rhodocytophaga rosea TaxID=2704465 RepID=A0A6C0GRJ1_9BACT|nr:molybdopterin cofactor-binding domain-containing protein [Rhodocytophaga rosea]QHT70686.1 xanthine dehydrogenase family protein molybdopterin-binding subunit [Rhodocytophaga rosea]